MDPTTRIITKSNDVSFDEHSFLQLQKVSQPTSQSRRSYSHINPYSLLGEDLDDDDINVSDDDYSDNHSGIRPNGFEVVNERINPSEHHPTSENEINSIPTQSCQTHRSRTQSNISISDSIDLTDNNETKISSTRVINLTVYPLTQDLTLWMKIWNQNMTISHSNKQPVSQRSKKASRTLLTPINPKYTQPTIATINVASH